MNEPAADAFAQHTPLMRQYFRAKSEFPDTLVFFRMGDFYELFFEDAVAAAPALDVALTKPVDIIVLDEMLKKVFG